MESSLLFRNENFPITLIFLCNILMTQIWFKNVSYDKITFDSKIKFLCEEFVRYLLEM